MVRTAKNCYDSDWLYDAKKVLKLSNTCYTYVVGMYLKILTYELVNVFID